MNLALSNPLVQQWGDFGWIGRMCVHRVLLTSPVLATLLSLVWITKNRWPVPALMASDTPPWLALHYKISSANVLWGCWLWMCPNTSIPDCLCRGQTWMSSRERRELWSESVFNSEWITGGSSPISPFQACSGMPTRFTGLMCSQGSQQGS